MTTLSRDFKPRRTPPPTGPRRIPLLRLVLLGVLVYYALQHRAFLHQNPSQLLERLQQVSTWFTHESLPDTAGLGRRERLALEGGKLFLLHSGKVQESWRVQDFERLEAVAHSYASPQVRSLVRSLGAQAGRSFTPGVLDLVFADSSRNHLPIFARFKDSLETRSLVRMPLESKNGRKAFMVLQTACLWQEPCPGEPLQGGAVPIGEDFDFVGRRHLLTSDLFRGIGEAPVQAVLPGRVREVRHDSTRGVWVELSHASNLLSRYFYLASLAEGIELGARIDQGQVLGRLSARDTAELAFQLLRNGQFVRWNEFRNESYPVSREEVHAYRERLLQ